MATYTITTTAKQDRAISWLVARINENATPAITEAEFVQQKASAALTLAQVAFEQQATELVPRRFAAATDAIKLQILQLLGLA